MYFVPHPDKNEFGSTKAAALSVYSSNHCRIAFICTRRNLFLRLLIALIVQSSSTIISMASAVGDSSGVSEARPNLIKPSYTAKGSEVVMKRVVSDPRRFMCGRQLIHNLMRQCGDRGTHSPYDSLPRVRRSLNFGMFYRFFPFTRKLSINIAYNLII